MAEVKETVLITGGAGYFGYRLGVTLQKRALNVILFDVRTPAQELPTGITFMQGDIRFLANVEKAMAGVSCVFHSASYGMSGREQLNRSLIEDVNVKGSANVIQACINQGVPRLVYTSTYNVVFGGQVIENGDESLPYLPLHRHIDHYSRTKAIAEMKILEANGSDIGERNGELRTCSLRSAGIYGPGEQRTQPRLMGYVKSGIFKFVFGSPKSVVQFVHVDNLISAHMLASEALKEEKNYIAAGQSYFISDGKIENLFEFYRPLVEGLGYSFSSVRLPLSLVYFFAFLTEIVHNLVGNLYNFQPFLTRIEVCKVGVTHYFSMEKARKDLGYKAPHYGLQEAVEWFKVHGLERKVKGNAKKHIGWTIVVGILLTMAVVSCIPAAASLTSYFIGGFLPALSTIANHNNF